MAAPARRCDGQGRVVGGVGALFSWWPIKAYRPCSNLAQAGVQYQRCARCVGVVVWVASILYIVHCCMEGIGFTHALARNMLSSPHGQPCSLSNQSTHHAPPPPPHRKGGDLNTTLFPTPKQQRGRGGQ